jgi:osmotically-inducible protein OsmY
MKQQQQIVVTGFASLVFAFSALAQDTANTRSNTSGNIHSSVSGNTHADQEDNTARNVRDRHDVDRDDRATRTTTSWTTNIHRNVSDATHVDQEDNTSRNVRDRDNRTQTPFFQGNNKADMEITAKIRKEILAGKNMSLDARNVKIITSNGRITLRGTVSTAEEKRIIGEIANRIAHAENVDNQLEVKRTNRHKGDGDRL